MKYFRDTNNNVYAYEADGSQDEYILSNLTPMTPSEVDAHINPGTTVQSKLAELEALYSSDIQALTSGYSEAEQKTWEVQLRQSKEYMLDSAAITPAFDALVLAKGSTKAVTAPIIIAKAEALELASLQLTGKYQKLVDDVNALVNPTSADLDAIVW